MWAQVGFASEGWVHLQAHVAAGRIHFLAVPDSCLAGCQGQAASVDSSPDGHLLSQHQQAVDCLLCDTTSHASSPSPHHRCCLLLARGQPQVLPTLREETTQGHRRQGAGVKGPPQESAHHTLCWLSFLSGKMGGIGETCVALSKTSVSSSVKYDSTIWLLGFL